MKVWSSCSAARPPRTASATATTRSGRTSCEASPSTSPTSQLCTGRLALLDLVAFFVSTDSILCFIYFFFYSSLPPSASSLGQSVEVRTIWALEISNKPGKDDSSKPKIRFVAGIHGNAAVGTELLLEFAAFLCINYGKNPYITTVSSGPPQAKKKKKKKKPVQNQPFI